MNNKLLKTTIILYSLLSVPFISLAYSGNEGGYEHNYYTEKKEEKYGTSSVSTTPQQPTRNLSPLRKK